MLPLEGAAVTALPQRGILKIDPQKRVLQLGSVHVRPVAEVQCSAKSFPPAALVPQVRGTGPRTGRALRLVQIGLPWGRRGRSVADDIHRQQPFRVVPQKTLQRRRLTGRSGIQHPSSLLQLLRRVGKAVLRCALYVFGAPQQRQLRRFIHAYMPHAAQVRRKGRAIHRAAPGQHPLRQQRKNASAGAAAA